MNATIALRFTESRTSAQWHEELANQHSSVNHNFSDGYWWKDGDEEVSTTSRYNRIMTQGYEHRARRGEELAKE